MILLFGIIMIMDDNRNAISNHIDKKTYSTALGKIQFIDQ